MEDLPFTLVLHGREDSVVPVGGSFRFVKRAVEKFGVGRVGSGHAVCLGRGAWV